MTSSASLLFRCCHGVVASVLTLPVAAIAQDPAPAPAPSATSLRRDIATLQGLELRYPRDKDTAVASVDGTDITLGEVARHIDERHAKGFADFLATPAGNLYFQQRLPADWVRHYADIVALRAAARYAEVSADVSAKKLEQAAAEGFAAWLANYEDQRKTQGVTTELTEERKASLRARHARENGLALERQGWLNVLTPDLDEVGIDGAHYFHREYPRYFGGVVHLAHILIYDRHPISGQLLRDADRNRASEMIAEVKARLDPTGANFEEVARLMSEDRRSGQLGGVLRNVSRFDSRLPPSVTRAAWDLRDGDWTGPIESSFGQHFVKRLSYTHHSFFLVTPSTLPKVRDIMRNKIQEDTMLAVRERHRVKLLF
jgi:hypothetical protein